MNSNCLILKLLLKVLKKLILEKKSADDTIAKFPSMQKVEVLKFLFFHINYVMRVWTTFHAALCLHSPFFFGHNFEGKNEKKNQQTTKSMLNCWPFDILT